MLLPWEKSSGAPCNLCRAVRTFATGKSYVALRIHRSPLIRNRDVGDKQRFADRLSRKRRALLEPGAWRRRSPQGLPARILQRPAQWFVVVIPSEIIAGVELQTMAVGIANIEKERVGDAVAARTALDVLEEAARGHHVAQMQHVHRGRHPIGKMMQARAVAVGDGEIMHIALAMHPRRRN